MVAYSFKPRFVPMIQVGLGHRPATPDITPKTHTIRDQRKTRGREEVFGHAYQGEALQLFCMQRSVDGYLIGNAICVQVQPILLNFKPSSEGVRSLALARERFGGVITKPKDLDSFARSDGFGDWADMRKFWADEHDGVTEYSGYIVQWKPNQAT